jgi:phosphatidylserine/phosphatidylglycerophosphate/cardiolipin synthase-like enzyme
MDEQALESFEQLLSDFCRQASETQVLQIAAMLRTHRSMNAGTAVAIAGSISTPSLRGPLQHLCLFAVKNLQELSPSSIALAMSTAARVRSANNGGMHIETVWTGPDHATMLHRKAAQALYDIIDEAKEELLIVSFVAHRVDTVLEKLAAALSRGVRVRLLLESSTASGGKLSYDSIKVSGLADLPGIEIWVWPESKRLKDTNGKTGTLHAKCAIADRRHALVTSANLTGYALHLNIELGLKIDGGDIPREIARQFEMMMEQGDVERVG